MGLCSNLVLMCEEKIKNCGRGFKASNATTSSPFSEILL
jgi:hypothetical protein